MKVIVREVLAAPRPLPGGATTAFRKWPKSSPRSQQTPNSSSPGLSLPGNHPSSPPHPPRPSRRKKDTRIPVYTKPGCVLSRTGILNEGAHQIPQGTNQNTSARNSNLTGGHTFFFLEGSTQGRVTNLGNHYKLQIRKQVLRLLHCLEQKNQI